MKKLNIADLTKYVENNISTFHQKRIDRLQKIKLTDILKRKNPYLFRAKNIISAHDLVTAITDAFISSNEETIFGDWLEGLAIFINEKVYAGWKSGIKGVDLEFDRDGRRFIVSIKSGPNWGNSSQIEKMKSDFKTAAKSLRTSNSNLIVVAVNGCCYGKNNITDKGEYFKYCGQEFWEFISGSKTLYKDIIEPLGHRAKERNDEFDKLYGKTINGLSKVLLEDYCTEEMAIDWDKLLEFNSGK